MLSENNMDFCRTCESAGVDCSPLLLRTDLLCDDTVTNFCNTDFCCDTDSPTDAPTAEPTNSTFTFSFVDLSQLTSEIRLRTPHRSHQTALP